MQIDLVELGFIFGVTKIDPTIGVIKADYITKTSEGKKYYPIELVPCNELIEGENYNGQSDNGLVVFKNFIEVSTE